MTTVPQIMALLNDHFRLYNERDPERERFREKLEELLGAVPQVEYAEEPQLRTVMELHAWRNAMVGLCTIWPKSPDEAADHLRKRLHDKLTDADKADVREQQVDAQKWVDSWMGNYDVVLKANAYHRILRYIAQVANSGRASRDWPMLDDFHLLGVIFAYNEGYSKAFDGRVFPNPFAVSGSQAAAWELGTRDGGEQRQKVVDSEKETVK